MRQKKTKIPHIHLDQLPSDIKQGILENGFTLHKNVMIVWNEKDRTDEILKFIDGISENVRKELILVSHQDEPIDLVWNDNVPPSFNLNNVRIGGKIYSASHYPYLIKR